MESAIATTQVLLINYSNGSNFEKYLYYLIPNTIQQLYEYISAKLPQETINANNIKLPKLVQKIYNDVKLQQYNDTSEVQYEIKKLCLNVSKLFMQNYFSLTYNKGQQYAYSSFLPTSYPAISDETPYTNYDLMTLNINQNNEYSDLYSKGYSQKIP